MTTRALVLPGAITDARIKTDKLDARVLAYLLRANLLPPAYVPSHDTRRVKCVLRHDTSS